MVIRLNEKLGHKIDPYEALEGFKPYNTQSRAIYKEIKELLDKEGIEYESNYEDAEEALSINEPGYPGPNAYLGNRNFDISIYGYQFTDSLGEYGSAGESIEPAVSIDSLRRLDISFILKLKKIVESNGFTFYK